MARELSSLAAFKHSMRLAAKRVQAEGCKRKNPKPAITYMKQSEFLYTCREKDRCHELNLNRKELQTWVLDAGWNLSFQLTHLTFCRVLIIRLRVASQKLHSSQSLVVSCTCKGESRKDHKKILSKNNRVNQQISTPCSLI